MSLKKSFSGFTLLEILIALFVFAILATIMTSALHHFLSMQAGLREKSERLRNVQMALLVIERDVSQAINRRATNADGQQEVAFIGKKEEFSLSHTGFANPDGASKRSSLQRTVYRFHDHAIWRQVWPYIDEAPDTVLRERKLVTDITTAHFEYADSKHKFYPDWPGHGENNEPLPTAVKAYFTIKGWGELTQLYLINAQSELKNRAKA